MLRRQTFLQGPWLWHVLVVVFETIEDATKISNTEDVEKMMQLSYTCRAAQLCDPFVPQDDRRRHFLAGPIDPPPVPPKSLDADGEA